MSCINQLGAAWLMDRIVGTTTPLDQQSRLAGSRMGLGLAQAGRMAIESLLTPDVDSNQYIVGSSADEESHVKPSFASRLDLLWDIEHNAEIMEQQLDEQIQEQAIQLIRNLITLSNVPDLDHSNEEHVQPLYDALGFNRLFEVLEAKLKAQIGVSRDQSPQQQLQQQQQPQQQQQQQPPTQTTGSSSTPRPTRRPTHNLSAAPRLRSTTTTAAAATSTPTPTAHGRVINESLVSSIVYLLVNISASGIRHRDFVAQQNGLLKALAQCVIQCRQREVRAGVCWLVTNLINEYVDIDDITTKSGTRVDSSILDDDTSGAGSIGSSNNNALHMGNGELSRELRRTLAINAGLRDAIDLCGKDTDLDVKQRAVEAQYHLEREEES